MSARTTLSVAPLFHINIARGAQDSSGSGARRQSRHRSRSADGSRSVRPATSRGAARHRTSARPSGSEANVRARGFRCNTSGRIPLRVRAELLKGINGHKGLVGSIGADKIWRDGDQYVFSVGPRVLFSDARYQRAYFGVTPAVACDRSAGLPAQAAASTRSPSASGSTDRSTALGHVRLRALRAAGRRRRQVADRSRVRIAQPAVRRLRAELHLHHPSVAERQAKAPRVSRPRRRRA